MISCLKTAEHCLTAYFSADKKNRQCLQASTQKWMLRCRFVERPRTERIPWKPVCFGKMRLALFFLYSGTGFECCRRTEGGCQYSLIEVNCKQKKALPQTDQSAGKPFDHINSHRQRKNYTLEYQFRSVIFLFELAILDIPLTDRPAPLSI